MATCVTYGGEKDKKTRFMRKKVIQLFKDWHTAKIGIYQLEREILSLLDENTAEGSTSDATSGGYTVLGNGTQAKETDKLSGEGVKSPLGKRTDTQEFCNCDNPLHALDVDCAFKCYTCKRPIRKTGGS